MAEICRICEQFGIICRNTYTQDVGIIPIEERVITIKGVSETKVIDTIADCPVVKGEITAAKNSQEILEMERARLAAGATELTW